MKSLKRLSAEMDSYDEVPTRLRSPGERREQRALEQKLVEHAINETAELLGAVRHVLRRVCTDPNFRHYMLHTESLERCAGAFVVATGEEVMDQIRDADPGQEADVMRLRREAELVCDQEPCGRCGPCEYAAELQEDNRG